MAGKARGLSEKVKLCGGRLYFCNREYQGGTMRGVKANF
jgi:hypothetical protein